MPVSRNLGTLTSWKPLDNFFSFPVAMNNYIEVGPLDFIVTDVCNDGEHYETPCILLTETRRSRTG